MRRREFTKSLATGLAALLSPFPRPRLARAGVDGGNGATLVFGYPNGFASAPAAIRVGDGTFSGSAIRLINSPGGHRSAFAWYTTKQPPTAFTTQFTFNVTNLGAGPDQSGLTFGIQDTVTPPGAPGYVGTGYAGDANMCGYGGGTTQNPPPSFDCDQVRCEQH